MATEASQVLEALSSLHSSTDRKSINTANKWLQEFQKKHEAWAVADYLIKLPDADVGTRLFAAQTLKQKITCALRELNAEQCLQLRDSLIELLWQSSNSPKAVMIQLCLAIADLAIQLLDWKTVIPDLVNKFDKSAHGKVCLLEILKILPEEMNENKRLPLTDDEYKSRGKELIDDNAPPVLELLTQYMGSSGQDTTLQEMIFQCLASWIRTGEMDINLISKSPLLQVSFKSLESPVLFDVAADVVSEIIYETRDVYECRGIFKQIYPYFATMLQKLAAAVEEEDDDAVRGYGRIFVQGGEAYINLIDTHPEALGTLMDGILMVSAYRDLEIVPMTFKFWYDLTNLLETQTYQAFTPQFLPYYDALVDIMIDHLRYPEDFDSRAAKERDEFRDFRHTMGDTLKDCCRILTPRRCLVKPMNLLTALLNNSEPTWQQIEAPIFSLRVMGSEVPEDENEVMPHIMKSLSQLPDHPKIRYAATLVISRYSFWTKTHPQFIQDQLNFISKGMQDAQVAAAGALALKYVCRDCKQHLVDYLEQLHTFYLQVVKTLPFRDIMEVTEAVSHVISVIPAAEIQNALQGFCLPVAQELNAIVSRGKDKVTIEDCRKIGDILEQMSVFFKWIRPTIPIGQPHPCVEFITELWPVLDATLANFGQDETVSEPLCKCFNSFIKSYGPHFVPLKLMECIVNAFANTGLSDYLWVAFELIREYSKNDSELPCFEFVQSLSQALFIKLQTEQIGDIPDVINEYFYLVVAFLENSPAFLLQDPLLQAIFQLGIGGLSITERRAFSAVLSFYQKLLAMADTSAAVVALFKTLGANLTAALFKGLVDFYSQDSISDVVAVYTLLAKILPGESLKWMDEIMMAVPEECMSTKDKQDFILNWKTAIDGCDWAKATRILSGFVAIYRRRNTNRRSF